MNNSNSNNKNIPVYKMWWFWVVIIGTVLIWISKISDNTSNDNNVHNNKTSKTETTITESIIESTTETIIEPYEQQIETVYETDSIEVTYELNGTIYTDENEYNNAVIESEIKECIKNAISPDYKDLMRYPNKYNDNDIVYTGKVLQVIETTSFFDFSGNKEYKLRVAVDSDYEKVIMTEITILENDPLILEDDIITIYGKSQGNYKYTAVLGNEITIPYIKTLSYELQPTD